MDSPSLHQHFVEALPQISEKAAYHFRKLDSEAREEMIAATVALTWKRYVAILEQGKDGGELLGPLAEFSARQVKDGRRIDGKDAAKDVMTLQTRIKEKFWVQSLPEVMGMIRANEAALALIDHELPVPDQVAFKLDFPEWIDKQKRREMLLDMLDGVGTGELAKKYGVSAARVSQIHTEAEESWREFTA